MGRIRCAAAYIREEGDFRDLVGSGLRKICNEAFVALGADVHLAVLFASHHFRIDRSLGQRARTYTQADTLIGASTETVIGNGHELESKPSIAIWLAHLPGVKISSLRLQFERSQDGGAITGWPEHLVGDWPADSTLILLGEPYSFPVDFLLERMNTDRPGIPVIGGMASGGAGPGENALWLHGNRYSDGAVGVVLSGDVQIEPVVSQGCRPIGHPLVITQAERNVIGKLGGAPAIERFHEVFKTLTQQEKELAERGLHVGLVTDEYRENFARGDFLVRNVLGGDPNTGAIAVGDYVRVGQTIQFHVRDAGTADEDLRALLTTSQEKHSTAPAGALLFTCNGRGTRLFPEPHHDASVLQSLWPGLPVAGLFAQGELGPVAGKNFMHGFTASVALFRERV